MTLARRVALNTASLVAGRILAVLAGFGAVALASRYLSVDGYGALTISMAYVSLFAIFTDLGVSTVATREIAREPEREREILGSVLALGVLAALGAAAAAAGVMFLVYPGAEDEPARRGIAILLVQLVCAPFVGAGRAHFTAAQRGYLLAAGDVALALAMVAFTAVAVVADLGYVAVVAATAGGYVVQGVALTALSRPDVRLAISRRPGAWMGLLRLGLPFGGTLIVNYLYFRLDVLLLSVLRTNADVAIYGVAYRVVEAFMVLPAYFMLTLFPEIARLSERRERVDALMREAMRVMELVALPVVVLTIVFAPEVVRVIAGSAYDEAAAVLRVLMLGVGISYLSGVYGNALAALGRQGVLLRLSLVVLGVNLALNLALIPPFGVEGASVAVALSELAAFLGIRRLYRQVGTPPPLSIDVRVLAAAAVMAVVVAPKFLLADAPALPLALAGGVVGLLAYALALVGLRALPEAITGLLPARLARPRPRT